jgi:serine/threonine protein kinase
VTPTVSYASILRRFGLRPILRYPWAVVGGTQRVQGWKFHLSSVQVQAADLLERVVPILRVDRVSFKVAQHDGILALLNEGDLGSTQVGKFLTIYPESDEGARQLAERLIAETARFCGPEVVTDLPLGSVVYARYGSFNPIVQRNRLGHHVPMIEAGDGSLVPDRYLVPFETPPHVNNPFAGLSDGISSGVRHSPGSAPRAQKLMGPGYLIVRPLKVRASGGVVLAVDLRRQDTVALKVVKFGRRHCLSDAYGRDIRDRLKQQAVLHAALAPRLAVPPADPYFEDDQHGYVAFQHIEGRDFEHLRTRVANQPWHHLASRTRQELLQLMAEAIGEVRRLHSAGYIHRDLSPSNLWVAADGKVYLLDLELAFPIGGTGLPFGRGTEGFMSPQQIAREEPTVADDVFAMGCVLTFLLGRLDPRRVIFSTDRHRRERLARMIQGVPSRLLEIICRCLDGDAARRPDLGELQDVVIQSAKRRSAFTSSQPLRSLSPPFSIPKSVAARRADRLNVVLKRGQRSVLSEAEKRGGLWLSSRSGSHSDRSVGTYEIERHANRGVAGVVYLLARLARSGYGTAAATRAVRRAVDWLVDTEPTADRIPGLHFGEAGVAVAITEAIAAGCVDRNERTDAFLRRGLTGALDWPDITHGAAGQGIAALYCGDRLQDKTLTDHVHACADFLLRSQASDGSWTLPPGIEGLSGQTLTGFAHGAAGITWFLAEYLDRFDCRDVVRPLRAAKHWLLARAVPTAQGERLEWPYGMTKRQRWHWWCHGGPGIALTFLKLYERSGNRRDADVARRALRAHRADIRYPNLTQCHGLSGLGEIYLEAARALREDEWRIRAENIAEELISLARQEDAGTLTWLVEDPHLPTADLMVGYGGVLHFLLRLNESRNRIGFPLLLDAKRG